jgi:hypothetical protein
MLVVSVETSEEFRMEIYEDVLGPIAPTLKML